MAAVSEAIVREFFEQNEFLVRQFGKYVAPAGREDDDFDFLVINPHAPTCQADLPPLLIEHGDLTAIQRAIVVVRPWHTEVFSPAFLAANPQIFKFLEKKSFQHASESFSAGTPVRKILIVPALPNEARSRDQSLEFIRSKGVDSVLTFRTILTNLVRHVEANRNYQKSDLLQTLRILKQHDFFKEPQLELFRLKQSRKAKKPKSH